MARRLDSQGMLAARAAMARAAPLQRWIVAFDPFAIAGPGDFPRPKVSSSARTSAGLEANGLGGDVAFEIGSPFGSRDRRDVDFFAVDIIATHCKLAS